MAECKDCIHFCVCSPYTAPNESYPEVDGCKCFRATADVVPKSEVDWNSIPVDVSEALKQRAVEKAKTEVAREIFEEIEKNTGFFRSCAEYNNYYLCIFRELDELKKKYT